MSLFTRQGRWSGWINLGLAVMAICGIIIGAATVSDGTDQILDRYGIEGTVFGATIVTAVLTIEDLFLTVRPIRGVPEIGIGNVIGSLIFSVTGKLGIVVLAGGSVAIGSSVLRWHLPALFVLTGVAAAFLWTGNLKRWHGSCCSRSTSATGSSATSCTAAPRSTTDPSVASSPSATMCSGSRRCPTISYRLAYSGSSAVGKCDRAARAPARGRSLRLRRRFRSPDLCSEGFFRAG